MSNGKIHDCPCDRCPSRTKCGKEALECKAVKQFYERGWYFTNLVGVNLKPMKMRKR